MQKCSYIFDFFYNLEFSTFTKLVSFSFSLYLDESKFWKLILENVTNWITYFYISTLSSVVQGEKKTRKCTECWPVNKLCGCDCLSSNVRGLDHAQCLIFTILLTFLGKSCNASGVYYSYMVSGPNFEFSKFIRNFWHQDTCFSSNSECLLCTKGQKWWIYENVSRIVKIVHSAMHWHGKVAEN